MAPKNKWELSDMVKFAVNYGHPIAIRYPRGEAWAEMKEYRAEIVRGKSEVIYEENQIALLAVGSMVKTACQVRENLKNQGYGCTLVNVRFVKPLDTELLDRLAVSHRLLVTMEENVLSGGFGEHAAHYLQTERGPEHLPKILNIAIKDVYVEHGNVELLRQELGIDADSVTGRIIEQAERL